MRSFNQPCFYVPANTNFTIDFTNSIYVLSTGEQVPTNLIISPSSAPAIPEPTSTTDSSTGSTGSTGIGNTGTANSGTGNSGTGGGSGVAIVYGQNAVFTSKPVSGDAVFTMNALAQGTYVLQLGTFPGQATAFLVAK